MFPGNQGPMGPNDGNGFFSGGGSESPPPADAMFDSFLGEEEDLIPDASGDASREHDILSAGLDFFEKIKKMR